MKYLELLNVPGIADDILVVGYNKDVTDHNAMLCRSTPHMQKKENLKLNKEKCHFKSTGIPFPGEIIARLLVQPDLFKWHTLMEYASTQIRKRTKIHFRNNKLP